MKCGVQNLPKRGKTKERIDSQEGNGLEGKAVVRKRIEMEIRQAKEQKEAREGNVGGEGTGWDGMGRC